MLEEQFDNSEDEFGHETKTVHRVLSMDDGALAVRLFDGSNVEDKLPISAVINFLSHHLFSAVPLVILRM